MICQIKTTGWWQRTAKHNIRVSGCISYSQQKFPENWSRLLVTVCDLILLHKNNSFSRNEFEVSVPKTHQQVCLGLIYALIHNVEKLTFPHILTKMGLCDTLKFWNVEHDLYYLICISEPHLIK